MYKNAKPTQLKDIYIEACVRNRKSYLALIAISPIEAAIVGIAAIRWHLLDSEQALECENSEFFFKIASASRADTCGFLAYVVEHCATCAPTKVNNGTPAHTRTIVGGLSCGTTTVSDMLESWNTDFECEGIAVPLKLSDSLAMGVVEGRCPYAHI